MISYDHFVDYYKSDVPNCPNAAIKKAVRESIIEWCVHTRMITATANDISVLADTAEYELVFPDNVLRVNGQPITIDGIVTTVGGESSGEYIPFDIDYAYLGDGSSDDTRIEVTSKRNLDASVNNWHVLTTDGDFTKIFLTLDNKIRVYPIPESDISDALMVTVVVKPNRVSTVTADPIYEDHVEDIRHGVLMRLFAMNGRPWFDPKGALNHKFRWGVSKGKGKNKALQGNNSLEFMMDFSGSTMF